MRLERDEFVVTFDSSKASVNELIALIKNAGYTAFAVTNNDEPPVQSTGNEPIANLLYVDSLARARTENKFLVLDFQATWCVPCKRMETETFSDPLVAALLERVVFVKVDTDKHPDVARHFGVVGLPDIRFLKPDGTEVRRLTDFQDVELFAEALRQLLLLPEERIENQGNDEPKQSLLDLSSDPHELKAAFNSAKGTVRLLLIASPG